MRSGLNGYAYAAAAALLALLVSTSLSAADDGQSLGELQRRAVKQRQDQQDFQAIRSQMEEKLSAALPTVVVTAVRKLEAKGVTFVGIEETMTKIEEEGHQYGLPTRISFADEWKKVGLANNYKIFVLPQGFDKPFELQGDMYWNGANKECEFWVDFSFDPSKSHPVGQYDCSEFLSGKLNSSFYQTFEDSVRQGLGSK